MIIATRFTDADVYLFNEGNHFQLYDKLGAHPMRMYGRKGSYFAVWAPNADRVSVVGDFNRWDSTTNPMTPRGMSGIWEVFVARATSGHRYKYRIWPRGGGKHFDKSDPMAFSFEVPPQNSSVIWHDNHTWQDREWMHNRAARSRADAPISIYEVHLGSWTLDEGDRGKTLDYRTMAPKLAEYVKEMGFTHVEIMPVMEHPFYGSWGYQVTGYFAPTSRYGTPSDFMFFIDYLHQHDIGVILDWSPAHFPNDDYALAQFDGTHLYEHADPRKGVHPDWNSLIFNYGRYEVKSFLVSSANFWLERFHADGLRVDGVASMIYLDYSRDEGQWEPNEDGSNENREATTFLRQLNDYLSLEHPDAIIIAEESTAWPKVSRPTSDGGLGFDYKWDMGWMHDSLEYMSQASVHRFHHHDKLTFRPLYAYSENFLLPLSHDEVVHGKGSLLSKMPGDEWQKFGNLRLLMSYMYSQPGKKLLFMGNEFGVAKEWNHDEVLEWSLHSQPRNQGMRNWVRDLNAMYRATPALHERDVEEGGFEWIHGDDKQNRVISYLRRDKCGADSHGSCVLVALNFSTEVHYDYRIGVPCGGTWHVLGNSDSELYGGTGEHDIETVVAEAVESHGREHSIVLALPPLGAVFLTPAATASSADDDNTGDANGSL